MFNNNFQQAVGASSEIFRFMDMEDEVREKPGAKRMGKFARAIRFADVSFSYSEDAEDSPLVLHGINLEVKRARCWRWWDRAARARARWCT
jgi:ATP-binding cassette, subfamily B, bacterial MsbA